MRVNILARIGTGLFALAVLCPALPCLATLGGWSVQCIPYGSTATWGTCVDAGVGNPPASIIGLTEPFADRKADGTISYHLKGYHSSYVSGFINSSSAYPAGVPLRNPSGSTGCRHGHTTDLEQYPIQTHALMLVLVTNISSTNYLTPNLVNSNLYNNVNGVISPKTNIADLIAAGYRDSELKNYEYYQDGPLGVQKSLKLWNQATPPTYGAGPFGQWVWGRPGIDGKSVIGTTNPEIMEWVWQGVYSKGQGLEDIYGADAPSAGGTPIFGSPQDLPVLNQSDLDNPSAYTIAALQQIAETEKLSYNELKSMGAQLGRMTNSSGQTSLYVTNINTVAVSNDVFVTITNQLQFTNEFEMTAGFQEVYDQMEADFRQTSALVGTNAWDGADMGRRTTSLIDNYFLVYSSFGSDPILLPLQGSFGSVQYDLTVDLSKWSDAVEMCRGVELLCLGIFFVVIMIRDLSKAVTGGNA
jgi:hypothetical protein